MQDVTATQHDDARQWRRVRLVPAEPEAAAAGLVEDGLEHGVGRRHGGELLALALPTVTTLASLPEECGRRPARSAVMTLRHKPALGLVEGDGLFLA